eukprot:COSAG04_NODE_2301_length_4364_cov_1.731770_2_plen_339_part_00
MSDLRVAADRKEAQCQAIVAEVQHDLGQAKHELDKALASLRQLNRSDLTTMTALANPPEGVRMTVAATCIMLGIQPEKKTDSIAGEEVDGYWKVGKALWSDSKFVTSLFDYDKDNIPRQVIEKITEYVENDQFQPEVIRKVSKACTAICQWVHAMFKYHQIALSVEPKRQSLADSQAELRAIMDNLRALLMPKLRPVLEPLLSARGIDWNDAVPALELVDTVEELAAAAEDPEGFLERLLSAAGPAAKKMAIARLRPLLEPALEEQGRSWDDVVPAMEARADIDRLRAGLSDPQSLMEDLLDAGTTGGDRGRINGFGGRVHDIEADVVEARRRQASGS